jgi:hypothetical protein
MATSGHDGQIAWRLEPTRDQWHAWTAARLGWGLDSFDSIVFVFIVLPIAQWINVPLTAVAAVFTLTLWLRLLGATGTGWRADRIGRTRPLVISIAWFSTCNFSAGFSPSLVFCLFSARCWASAWVRSGSLGALPCNGKLADPFAWSHGGNHGAWVACSRRPPMGSCIPWRDPFCSSWVRPDARSGNRRRHFSSIADAENARRCARLLPPVSSPMAPRHCSSGAIKYFSA